MRRLDHLARVVCRLIGGLAIIPALQAGAAIAGDVDCARYERFTFEQIWRGGDPWARRCAVFVDAGSEERDQVGVDKNRLALVRIYSDYEFGHDARSFERARIWLSENPDAPEEQKTGALSTLMRAAKNLGQIDVAIDAARELVALGKRPPSEPTPSFVRYHEGELAILGLPEMRTTGDGALIGARTTPHGHTDISVSIGGAAVDAAVDTGSEISVVSSDMAERLGFRTIDGVKLPLQHLFGEAQYARLAVAPTMRMGDMTIENAVFLVFDRDIAPPGNPKVVLGLSLFESLGRIAFLDHGKTVAFGAAAPDIECMGGSGRLFRHNDGIGMSVRLSGDLAPAHYDTGFPRSYAYAAPIAFYAPDLRYRRLRGGPSKIDRSPLVIGEIRELAFEIGGEPIVERHLPVFRSEDPDRKLDIPLVVGGTTTRRLDVMALDFRTMRYAAVKTRSERSDACLAVASAASSQN